MSRRPTTEVRDEKGRVRFAVRLRVGYHRYTFSTPDDWMSSERIPATIRTWQDAVAYAARQLGYELIAPTTVR